ncbi:phosphatidylserine decarboxylase family protein [Nitratidesulfovibrio sp. SRB-5]|uniref:Phosphatidylserine decarboxylase proenzyme n=1 Tax=Nitratidesulfovibrio vulgaris (strain DSM 19637 / Miyazaki F) TaxID=883 RepID=B8DM89_NITV9|nr:phosphatidylserine decarboxylase family protein [Nitratidesulfovibrio sp. SRB-5]MBZ2172050.1 phosphatidylserine decarboxylase family protein [Nitratidesulfovibrio sp. SRB-5]
MRKASIGITPEGVPAIGLCALVTLSLAMLGCATGSFVFMLLTWFCCHFFRDPERVTPTAPGLAVSPADGKVVRVQTMPDPFTGQPRTAVCIFMNVFSVHVNRAPVAGTVTGIAYHPGKFLNAAWDKASTDNERCAYQMTEEGGSAWTFVQIAGLIARRIVCRTDEGDVLARGERFGMIRFGSRVDLYLPDDYSPAVNVGEQVFAGQTIVARRNA